MGKSHKASNCFTVGKGAGIGDGNSRLGRELPLSGIVLAGGQSRRMGRDKAFMTFQGRSLIERTLDVLARLCQELIIVADRTERYAHLARTVPDVFKGRGTLGGIHAGLAVMIHDLAIVVACDMPFLNLQALDYMVGLAPGCDVVVPHVAGYYEPLHAVYRRSCVGPIADLLAAGPSRIVEFYDQVRVCRVGEEDIRRFDPDLRTLTNVNTPKDWGRLHGKTGN